MKRLKIRPRPTSLFAFPLLWRVGRYLTTLGFGLGLGLAATAQAAPSVYPTGVTRYDPARAWNSYYIFSDAERSDAKTKTYLIDMNGNVVRQWNHGGFPAGVLNPATNKGRLGDVFVNTAERSQKDPRARGNGLNNHGVGVVDWNGALRWQWSDQAPGGSAFQHHDWHQLPNGNFLILANRVHKIPGFKLAESVDDVIYEVTPDGKVAWEWLLSEHLEELGFSPEQLDLIRNGDAADAFHTNNLKVLGPNKWFDQGDTRFHPDNLLIDTRVANFMAIIDRRSGNIVWRIGPDFAPANLLNSTVPRPVDQLAGMHDATMIAKGLPGEGHILVFDNQGGSGYPPVAAHQFTGSRVLEINPVTQEIVWQYTGLSSGDPIWAFHSSYISNATRLPNGNTLINEGMFGRAFQVTREGEIVWEYVSPYKTPWIIPSIMSNYVYRMVPVPYEWVPADTPRSEKAITPPALEHFRVP